MKEFFSFWADPFLPTERETVEASLSLGSCQILGVNAQNEPVSYQALGIEICSEEKPGQGYELLIAGVGFRSDRPELGELVLKYPAYLEISFPMHYPEETFAQVIQEQRRCGLASLEALRLRVLDMFILHMYGLESISHLKNYIAETFRLKPVVWRSREDAREAIMRKQLRPRLRLHSLHLEGTRLSPGSRVNEGLFSGEDGFVVYPLQVEQNEEGFPLLPRHWSILLAVSRARQAVILLRYYLEIESTIKAIAYGGNVLLEPEARPSTGSEHMGGSRQKYLNIRSLHELIVTLEQAISIKKNDPHISNRALWKALVPLVHLDDRGVEDRLERALCTARTGGAMAWKGNVHQYRTPGRYRLEELEAALEALQERLQRLLDNGL